MPPLLFRTRPFKLAVLMTLKPDHNRYLPIALLASGLFHIALVLLTSPHIKAERNATDLQHPAPAFTARLAGPTPEPTTDTHAGLAIAELAITKNPKGSSAAPPSAPAPGMTRGAYPLDPVDLDIPEARLPTVRGTLVLRLWISAQGQVTAFEPESTDLPEEYVTAVGETFATVRFAPALKNGRPVASVLRIEIHTEDAAAPR
jgi:hypothetical protein